jgi:hypothetical protein
MEFIPRTGRASEALHPDPPAGKVTRVAMMKPALAVLIAAFGLPFGMALAADPKSPTAEQILDRYIEATGGRAALERLKSRVMKGTIEMAMLGISGEFEVFEKSPNKKASKTDLKGFGVIREGYDGQVAWSSAPFQGVAVKRGAELARVQRSALFPRELKLQEAYERLEVKGATNIGATVTWVVEAVTRDGVDTLYFDQKSGLLIREETVVKTALGEITFQNDLGDYREVDGIKVPFSIRLPKPAEVGFSVRFTHVKHNVEIPDSAFAKPD